LSLKGNYNLTSDTDAGGQQTIMEFLLLHSIPEFSAADSFSAAGVSGIAGSMAPALPDSQKWENLIDGYRGTYAAMPDAGASNDVVGKTMDYALTFELYDAPRDIAQTQIMFLGGAARKQAFEIWFSSDGVNYAQVYKGMAKGEGTPTSNAYDPANEVYQSFPTPGADVKFVKIYLQGHYELDGVTPRAGQQSLCEVVFLGPEAAVPPVITSADSATVAAGGTFQVTADGTEPIAYSLGGDVPEGVTIGGDTGLITVDASVPAGTYTFTITAGNGNPPDALQTFTLTVTAGETAAVTDMQIVSQPKLIYNELDTLDLSALFVEVTYGGGSSETVKYADFESRSITLAYSSGNPAAMGDVLRLSKHNGLTIVITCGNVTAETAALTVTINAKYDINGDGKVDSADLTLIMANLNKKASTNATTKKCDVDGNGIVDMADYSAVAAYIAAVAAA
ncbi:MAG: dockerin type I domain-containing protein, partial [Defluviitaleaceae bacterium]|nr:dockerin type I domain-containing protein [Defluviitaleaceae bacterium]